MDYFSGLFLFCYFIIGVYIVYTDIKLNKIYNKQILLIEIILFFQALFVFSKWFLDPFFWDLFMSFLAYSLIGIVISLAMYYWKVWAAGDAKLYMHLVFALGLFVFGFSNYNIFLAFLGNIFIIPLVLLFYDLIMRTKLRHYKKYFSSLKNEILDIVLIIFVSSWLLSSLLNLLNIQNVSSLLYFLNYIIIFQIRSKFKSINLGPHKNYNLVTHLLLFFFVLRVFFDFKVVFTFNFLMELSKGILFMIFLRHLGYSVAKEHYVSRLDINNLKVGMILNESINLTKDGSESRTLKAGSKLNNRDILFLKDLPKTKDFSRIEVQHHVAFGIFIFIGFFATIILKTLIVFELTNWFSLLLIFMQN